MVSERLHHAAHCGAYRDLFLARGVRIFLGLQAVLKPVSSVLAELNLAPTSVPIRYYINISTGYAISISAYLDAHTFYQIKASEFVDLSSEYEANTKAWVKYQELAPQPLGYRERAGWSITVARGVRNIPFDLEAALRGNRASQEALQDLNRYFEIGGQKTLVNMKNQSHDGFLLSLEHHFLNTPYAKLAAKWTSIARSIGIESLQSNEQHGDFTVNNIARSDKHLIIFDWEDYGACKLPGLDLTSLIFSAYSGIASIQELLHARDASKRPIDIFVRHACHSCGFDMQFFQQLFPFYLLVLMYSKRNYGRALQERIGSLIDRLTH